MDWNLLASVRTKSCFVGDGDGLGDGAGEVVGLGSGVADGLGIGVAVGDGDGDGAGVGDGIGAAEACFFQVSFLPCLVQMKFEPFDFLTCPTFVHNAPALTAAFVWIAGMDTREIEISTTISFWGARTGEVSQGKPRETITIESRNDAALVGSPA